jgi:pimeloyl-ACP methyl ester carboxylesterase
MDTAYGLHHSEAIVDERLLPGFASRVIERDGRAVAYRVGGRGDAIALVHGLGGAATNWSEMASSLARRFRVVVPDLPGHGASSPLPSRARDLAPFTDAVAACLAAEGAAHAFVVGHSLGGLVALRLALRAPASVRGLVLAAPSAISSTSTRARVGLELMTVTRPARRISRFRIRITASRTLRRIAFVGLVSDPDALSAEATLGFLEGARIAADTRSAAKVLIADDPRTELNLLPGTPTIVLWGARDRMLPVDDGIELARRLGCPLRVLGDTGHLLIGERPQACVRHVTDFVDHVRSVELDTRRSVAEHGPALAAGDAGR